MASEGDTTLNAAFGQRREGETAQEFDLTLSPRLPISSPPSRPKWEFQGEHVREGGGGRGGKGFYDDDGGE